jgi:FixJ family two-component response regulator
MSESPAPIFIVDDDDLVRKALARLLNSAGYVAACFSSARAFLTAQRPRDTASCLVLDVQMPELTGMDLQRELEAANALLPIVFLTGHGDIPMSVQAMKAGASDFLVKPVHDESLLRAVELALARGELERAIRKEREAIASRVQTLTPREYQVLSLVVEGLLNKQIADRLGTVEKTIKVHRGRLMEKMKVNSLAELVHVAAKVGIPRDS